VPRHLGVPSAVSKMIYEPVVHSTQTMHLSCVMISTISNELSQHPLEIRHLGVLLGVSKTISEPRYVWHKPCTYLAPTPIISPN
jgi:hypothetical protein